MSSDKFIKFILLETMTYDKTYKTAIVLIPPEHTWHSIQQIRKLHDKQFNRWMPHITLSYPFLPYAHLEAVCNTLKNKLQNFSPFEVNLNTFQYFRHHTNTFTIWLKPDHERRIFDLHEAIWKLFPEFDDTRKFFDGYTPHMRVGQLIGSKAELFDQISELQDGWKPIKWRVDRLSLIYRNDLPDDEFRIGEEVHFY